MKPLFFLTLLFCLTARADTIPSNTLRLGDGAGSDKTITFNKGAGSANPQLKWTNSTSKLQFTNDGVIFQDLGSGSGGGINFVTNPDLESATTGYASYKDAAGVSPVDGTGGTPTVISFSRTTSSPLTGLGSLLITKTAANGQGEGVSYDFTISRASLAKQHTLSFDYEVASGTYDAGSDTTDPDLTAWIYGPTDGTPVMTQLAPYKILGCSSGTVCRFQGNFQTAASGVNYRLILHEAKTGTSAYTFKADSISVSPVVRSFGAPVTDWASYTPTITGLGTGSGTVNSASYRRMGDSIQVQINFTKDGSGGSGAANVGFSLPSGLSFDTAKFATGSAFTVLGVARYYSTVYTSSAVVPGGTNVINISRDTSGNAYKGADIAAGANIGLIFTAPVTGWGSTVQLSQDAGDSRAIVASFTATGALTVSGSYQVIPFSTKGVDTHGALTTGASARFTAPSAGYYRATGQVKGPNTTSESLYELQITKNGTQVDFVRKGKAATTNGTLVTADITVTVFLNAGDYLDLQLKEAPTSVFGSLGAASFYVERVPAGSQQIAASDTVAASYVSTATTTYPTSETVVNFDSKEFDTHNAVTTGAGWTFTAPISGKYQFTVQTSTNNVTGEATASLFIYKNGSGTYSGFARSVKSASTAGQLLQPKLVRILSLFAGDTIQVKTTSTGAAMTYDGSQANIHIGISRIGN